MTDEPTIRDRLARALKPSPGLVAAAKRLAAFAHSDWVVFFFLALYFFDSFLIFLPADGLIALTLLLAPEKQRSWTLAAAAGSLSGFAIFYFLSLSSLQPWVIDVIHQNDLSQAYDRIVASASTFGYLNLVLAVSTVVPPAACLIAGIVIGLNPFVVLVIVFSAKVARVLAMIYLMRYVKISIAGLRERRKRRLSAGESS